MVYWIGVKCMMPPSQALLKCKVLVEGTNRAAIVLSTNSKHLPRYAPSNSLYFWLLKTQATGARGYERFTGMQIAKIIEEELLGFKEALETQLKG